MTRPDTDGDPVQPGAARPLLLIHSINAAASAAEVRPLVRHFQAHRPVIALDLPGFGSSVRDDRRYTPRVMTDAITGAAQRAAAEGGPVDALAVSLSCEFLARSASEHPTLYRSLAWVSPTGFSGKVSYRQPAGTTAGKDWLYALLRGPGWGPSLYRQLTRPGVIRYFLERTWGSKGIDEELWAEDVSQSRQPGAHFAPLYFLSGHLFSRDIQTVYESLSLPVWVSHGVRGDFVDYRQLPSVAARRHWRVTVFETGAMPHFERPALFCHDFESFLLSAGSPAEARARSA